MIEQFEVFEEQDKTIIPYVFRVGTGEGEYATPELAEAAAHAKFHEIMIAAYGSQVPYHGSCILHRFGKNKPIIEDDEMVERAVNE